jgi:hypothetical protein
MVTATPVVIDDALADLLGVPHGTPYFGGEFAGPGHTYIVVEDGIVKVDSVPLPPPQRSADGTWTQGEAPDFPAKYRSANYHRATKGDYGSGVYSTPEPRAAYNTDGTVKTAGWLPGGRWAELDGSIWKPEGVPAAGSDPMGTLATAALAFAKTVTG